MDLNESLVISKQKYMLRIIIYLCGLIILALGTVINVKTNLGASAVTSLYCTISEISSISLGNVATIMFISYVIVQLILLKKESKLKILLQIPVSIIFGKVTDFFNEGLDIPMNNYFIRSFWLLIGIMLIALGVILIVKMKIVPDPANGLVYAISNTFKVNLGLAKNILDIAHVAIALIIGIIMAHRIIGAGIGTIFAAIFIGRFVSLYEKILKKCNLELG